MRVRAAAWKNAAGSVVTDFSGWTAATLTEGSTATLTAGDAVQSVDVLQVSGGFSEFASADGSATAVACSGSDAIVGLSLDKDGSGNVIRITATCATPADVACTHYNAAGNSCWKYGSDGKDINDATKTGTAYTGTYIDLSTNQCTECPAGTYLEVDGDEGWTCTPW